MEVLPKIVLALTAVTALSVAYPTSVQAVPTTYKYTGNPFNLVSGVYTTSMFVTVMLTLAQPLHANMPRTEVFPTAFTFFDGIQTITDSTASIPLFIFATDAAGHITEWDLFTEGPGEVDITTFAGLAGQQPIDEGFLSAGNFGDALDAPGTWTGIVAAPDAGFTLTLMTLTLMALGLVARRFQRAAG